MKSKRHFLSIPAHRRGIFGVGACLGDRRTSCHHQHKSIELRRPGGRRIHWHRPIDRRSTEIRFHTTLWSFAYLSRHFVWLPRCARRAQRCDTQAERVRTPHGRTENGKCPIAGGESSHRYHVVCCARRNESFPLGARRPSQSNDKKSNSIANCFLSGDNSAIANRATILRIIRMLCVPQWIVIPFAHLSTFRCNFFNY